MKKEISAVVVALLAFALVGCGNRYLKNFRGEAFAKTDRCEVVNVEWLSVKNNETLTMMDLKKSYEDKGYALIGLSNKNKVPLNGRHQDALNKACRKMGGHIALYGDYSSDIFFFRKDIDVFSEEGLGDD
ncbi:hypothetical protein SAMN05720469_11643 [Fibrobacter intestinalis]|uniref:Lipoprotein n=1 Tax=Fibrobacter intestinalis TaxID=28122 RepID=A0A1M6V1V9_9BACT|nr:MULTISPECIES: hypothetical protein [Fibrobacter]PBC66606.1 hypothetical protein BGX14_2233 [Fibrobacter sp. UWS1]SHK75418.1 hypothetical protein SAMN05720469_11643 [Fibrobacter intestinalis]